MNKELVDKLRHIQANPTTGTPHNGQVIFTQVETIFMLDELRKEIKNLSKNIKESDEQSKQLEISNYKLQWAMFFLTFVGVAIAAYPVLNHLLNLIISFLPKSIDIAYTMEVTAILSSILATLVGMVTSFYSKKYYDKNLLESIKISDSFEAVLKDKEENTKEVRSQ